MGKIHAHQFPNLVGLGMLFHGPSQLILCLGVSFEKLFSGWQGCGEMETLVHCCVLLVGMQNGVATVESGMVGPQKVEGRITV